MSYQRKAFDPACIPDLLPVYYRRLFPHELYYRWLSYGDCKLNFVNREFSFVLKDDIYVRYQSFSDQQDLEREIQKKCPYKIDIGAIFSHKPKEHKTIDHAVFQPLQRELIFDIDISDYDDVRYCCRTLDCCCGQVCAQLGGRCRKDEACGDVPTVWCFCLLQMLAFDDICCENFNSCIERTLDCCCGQVCAQLGGRCRKDEACGDVPTVDFGFQDILWVFSGRRGIHCWVCDASARNLSHVARSAIVEYLSVVKGGENQTAKVKLDKVHIHPSIQKALDILEEEFVHYACVEQDFLGDEDRCNRVLALIFPEELRNMIAADMREKADSISRYERLRKFIKMSTSNRFPECQRVVQEIILQYCYPRLDVNVSVGLNHLLKSPFCIHPKTGQVCVPFDAHCVDVFDPSSVPSLNQLVDEINDNDKPLRGCEKALHQYTSLRDSIEVFDKFVRKLENKQKAASQEQAEKKIDF